MIETEQDIGKAAAEWLESQGFEVFHEVHPGNTGIGVKCADLVGLKTVGNETIIHVIECKLQHGIPVLDQAHHWASRRTANFVTVATKHRKPKRLSYWRRTRNRSTLYDLIHESTGIGWLVIFNDGKAVLRDVPRPIEPDGFWSKRLAASCTKHHQNGEFATAGTQRGHRVTKFRLTANTLIDAVRSDPGRVTGHYVDQIDHHYASRSSAVSNLNTMIDKGVIVGLYIVEHNRTFTIYPDQIDEGNMKTEFKYIQFVEQARAKDQTRSWKVESRKGDDLGFVKWSSKWKKFVFQVNRDTVYDKTCLADITAFLEQLLS